MSLMRGRFTSGSTLRQYLLVEPLTEDGVGTLWKAQDTVLGRVVALKILHPETVADHARRELIIVEARAAARFEHPSVARTDEVDVFEEAMLIVSDHAEGEPLNKLVRGKPLSREWFLRLSIALVDAIHAAHHAEVIHGNLQSPDVVVAENGSIRIRGFGTGRGSSNGAPGDPAVTLAEHAFYFSPERVLGRPLDARSDIFSLGAILYEMATGTVPFPGTTPEEVYDRIINKAPPAPQLFKRNIDPAIVTVIGRCLHKDPTRRYQSASQLQLDLRKLTDPATPFLGDEPSVSPTAAENAVPTRTPPVPDSIDAAAISDAVGGAIAQLDDTAVGGDDDSLPDEATSGAVAAVSDVPEGSRESTIFLASIPPGPTGKYEPAVERLAGVMQQIVGEAVYLHDGRIVDPFGARMIAEFDDAAAALLAAKEGKQELEAYNGRQRDPRLRIEARLVVHRGILRTSGGSVIGPAVDAAQAAVLSVAPLTPVASLPVLALAGIPGDLERVPTLSGTDFYLIPEKVVEEEPAADESAQVATAQFEARKRRKLLAGAAAAAAILLIATVAGLFALQRSREKAAAAEAQRRAVAAESRKVVHVAPVPVKEISIDPLWVDAIDSSRSPDSETIMLAAAGILDVQPGVNVVVDSAAGEKFSATLRQGVGGMEIIPVRIAPESSRGQAVPFSDTAGAARILASWISERLQIVPPPFMQTSPETMNLFARAVAERRSAGKRVTPQLAEHARALARADANFAPGQLLALGVFEDMGESGNAIASAATVLVLDPRNTEVRKRLAVLRARAGTPSEAIAHFAKVLAQNPDDVESLRAIGLFAWEVDDRAALEKVIARLGAISIPQPLHREDLLLGEGRVDQAARPLSDLEVRDPNNPYLALKIGRVAVLRHMNTIADIELKKLRQLDPAYGYPMLQAYVSAGGRKHTAAASHLQEAIAGATWYDLPYTHAAEVYALLGSSRDTMEWLERAQANGEPTGRYITNSPLFSYVKNEARFRRLRQRFEASHAGIRIALRSVPL